MYVPHTCAHPAQPDLSLSSYKNIQRWFDYLTSQETIKAVADKMAAEAKQVREHIPLSGNDKLIEAAEPLEASIGSALCCWICSFGFRWNVHYMAIQQGILKLYSVTRVMQAPSISSVPHCISMHRRGCTEFNFS